MYCNNCGFENIKGDQFCSSCGNQLKDDFSSAREASNINTKKNHKNKFYKKHKFISILILGVILIYFFYPSKSHKIDVSDYFENQPMTKISYMFGDDGQVVFGEEYFIDYGNKDNVLEWTKTLYNDPEGNIESTGIMEGVYELYTDKIVSIETFGGFHTNEERIVLSNTKKWSASRNSGEKSYINAKVDKIQTEAGMFYDCIEVITEETGVRYRKYYAPGMGLILQEAKIDNQDWFVFKELMAYEIY